jgi:hypothetical protein
MNIKPEIRDNLNLLITFLAFLLIPAGGAFLNSKMDTQTATITAHSDAAVAALKQSITENYETASAHKTDMDALTVVNKTLWQGQRDLSDKVDKNNVEQRLAIQHLGDMIQIGNNQTKP